MPYQTLIFDDSRAPVAVVRLNRPDAANALNTQMARDLADAFSLISKHNSNFHAIILAGEGKHFCAGADLKERKGMDTAAWHAQHELFEKAMLSILYCEVPVIAAVHGAAYAGGLELALACDFIYAADNARFALTEASLGIMPGLGGTQTLPRAVGQRRARELLYAAKPFSVQDAATWGMVNEIHPQEKLMDAALAAAHVIAQNAPLSVKAIKRSIHQGASLSIGEALACELAHYETLLDSKDRHEGIDAFNKKRKAAFTGE